VAAPNVDLATELTDMESASRAFEINLQTVQSMSDLVRKLYDLE
jgi:flagellar basal body rod protein FlgC